jgi:hypothetical protein
VTKNEGSKHGFGDDTEDNSKDNNDDHTVSDDRDDSTTNHVKQFKRLRDTVSIQFIPDHSKSAKRKSSKISVAVKNKRTTGDSLRVSAPIIGTARTCYTELFCLLVLLLYVHICNSL